MKYIKISFLAFTLLSGSIFSQDNIEIPGNIKLSNHFKSTFDYSGLEFIYNDDYKFNGYLIIKLDSNSIITDDSQFFYTNVYWVDSIKYYDNIEKSYWYYNLAAFTLQLTYSKLHNIGNFRDSLFSSFYYFSKYYVLFNEANSNCKSYLYSQSDLLTTNILENHQLYKNVSIPKTQFLIFKCSFTTAILGINTPIYLNQKDKIDKMKILIPISELYEFNETTLNEVENFGFVKSEDKIKLR
jgi:hypothetical protein